MANLPKVRKGIGSGLTRFERVTKAVLGLAFAVGLASAAGSPIPSIADAKTPTLVPAGKDQGAIVLTQESAQAVKQQIAQHYSHYSHYSHSSHYSHGSHHSHYSSRW